MSVVKYSESVKKIRGLPMKSSQYELKTIWFIAKLLFWIMDRL